jgi:hypothetical protein
MFTTAIFACIIAAAQAQPPSLPTKYSVTLAWSQVIPSGTAHFKHQRWYDLDGQRYRDDTFSTDSGLKTDEVLEFPGENKRYDENVQTGVCNEQPDQSEIDGFVKTYPDMVPSDDTVGGVKAQKWSKKFTGYNVAVWFAKGDPKVADGTPLQTYNSYNEEQKVMVKGLTRITAYNTKVSDKDFALPAACATPVTPSPTPKPPKPADDKHWNRDWTSTECKCMKTKYIGTYKTEADCMAVECPKVESA